MLFALDSIPAPKEKRQKKKKIFMKFPWIKKMTYTVVRFPFHFDFEFCFQNVSKFYTEP
jgi:hypothetical protein